MAHYCGIILMAACVGCTASDGGEPIVVSDSAGITIVESNEPLLGAGAWTLAPDPRVTIGLMEGPQEFEFTRIISVLRLPDGRIVAANFTNPPNVRVYSPAGEHLSTFGGPGAGPGEFQAIAWIDLLSDDTLRVFDFWQARVTYFDLTGNLFGTMPLLEVAGSPMTTFVLAPGFTGGDLLARLNRLIPQDAQGRGRTFTPLVRVSRSGRALDTLVTIPDAEYHVAPDGDGNLVHFTPRSAALPSGDRMFVTTAEAYRIDEYTGDGVLRRSLRRTDPPRSVGPADVAALLDQRLERARSDAERVHLERSFNEVPHADMLPAYDRSILLDDIGNLWAKQYAAPRDSLANWDIFDESGRYLTVITVPLAFNIVDVGSDDVLGIWRDELGVESIRLYELQKRP